MVDAESGDVIQDYVAKEGYQLVPIQEPQSPAVPQTRFKDSDQLPYSGWDGLGENADAYVPAKVFESRDPLWIA